MSVNFMNVLIVCAANIVRSFMAEVVMKKRLKARGAGGISVASAALLGFEGRPADPLAVKILEENGIIADNHLSRRLTREMVDWADVIAVMEKAQKRELTEKYTEAEGKTTLLKSFMKGYQEFDPDIKDPSGLTMYHYRLCFSEISLAVSGMIDALPKLYPAKDGTVRVEGTSLHAEG